MAGILKALSPLYHWRAIDESCRRREPTRGWDWRPAVVLVTVAVSLTLQEYFGQHGDFRALFPPDGSDRYYELKGFAWWSAWRFVGYVVVPVAAIWLSPGDRVRDYYLGVRGLVRHLWVYAALFLLIVPVVVAASRTLPFQRTYPFYKWSNRSDLDLFAWEALYSLQFVSLEFFFRGFMLRGLAPFMGSRAIFVMVVPYCMIHYGKPVAETLGAIIAGVVLGTLAMRTRSIWGGVAIHIAVAVMMDVLALGYCPEPGTGLPCSGH